MENVINTLHLSGKVVGTPVVGHEAFGEKFYYLTLGVPRLSGAQDLLPVTLSERLLDGAMLSDGDTLAIDGQVRSYNKIIEGAGRLLITAFAQKIVENDEHENPNQIQLTGTLCKAPAYRTTPFGREIADMMLAVNRAYGKSDYIPCITWGRSARFAAKLDVGDKITLTFNLGSCTFCATCADFCSRKAIELTGDYHMIATKEEDLLVTGSFIKKPPVKKAAPAPAAKPAAEAPAAPAEAPAAEVRPRDDGKPVSDPAKCVYCTLCARKCPAGAIEVDRANKTWKLDDEKCVACGTCAEACPKKCIIM